MYRPVMGLGFLSKRFIIAIALTVCIIWAIRWRGPELETIRDFAHLSGGNEDRWMTKRQFVKRALQDDLYVKEYNGTAVRDLCGKTKWQDGIAISCDEIAGGIGNLKMRLLGCTRYVIEAGAMLITPVIHPRQAFEKMEQSFGWDVDLPLDYVFDSEHFYETLAQDCPQLRIVNDTDPTLNIPPKQDAYKLRPNSLVQTSMGEHVVMDPKGWRPAFDKWVDGTIVKTNGHLLSAQRPVRISFDEWVQFSWPNAYDGEEFKNDWGHAARVRQDIRELSARALYKLYKKIGCRQSPHAPSKNCFLGAHVRTEADAKVEGWDTYETQMQHAREQLETHNLSVLYVATGTASDVDRLKADLKDLTVRVNETHEADVQVLQKWDLLEEEDMMLMDGFTWDQMALVDMDIMLRASRFEGIWESSWTWMIALKRHEWSEDTNPFSHQVTFEDGLSKIYGAAGMQPFIPPTMYL
ncbi:hypothetical protein M406DRAFT_349308 [Cryphonectria parasitica EP155]|uniref:Alternative oxidase n=1 Tax=Cryphonectria parasitica (strain ATCC 38755 / EP155) TaxID=660469 RepID=A0A9P5CUQ1_CRYP1|nr:uncharacterized protein M406DRAFT_349308 [Cryphonectria parasitica EP155]KAF3770586.1 hypothetical protein M406DRAFT_349308 [Cryphonectria parasitica EP155]